MKTIKCNINFNIIFFDVFLKIYIKQEGPRYKHQYSRTNNDGEIYRKGLLKHLNS